MSHQIAEIAGLTVSTFAAGAGRGQRVQLTYSLSNFTTLSPEDSARLGDALRLAAVRAGYRGVASYECDGCHERQIVPELVSGNGIIPCPECKHETRVL